MENKLKSLLPHRSEQVHNIFGLIGQRDEPMPPSVFLYGHTGTGKSLVMETILKELKYKYAMVNCIQSYAPELLFNSILSQLCGETNCDNALEFVNRLKGKEWKDPVFIVLDHCERLRHFENTALPVFLRLQELTQCFNLSVFLLSDVVWEKYRPRSGFVEPLQVHFLQYQKDNVVDLLLKDKEDKWPENFYVSYLKLFLGIFYRACRDLTELQYMAQLNFPKYCEPIQKGEITMDEVNKLGRLVTPHLKESLTQLYLRSTSNQEQEKVLTSSAVALSFELPFYTKYFLIAAYLASHNPARTDRCFFMKNHGKEYKAKKKQQRMAKKQAELLMGPKAFSVDRLLAIFYSIVEGGTSLTAILLSQISSLVKLQLLTVVGDECIDIPKYKCIVDFEFISTIAKTVGFNIKKYLYEYL